jgi:hypothetical protein
LGSPSSFSLKDSPTFDTKSPNEILSSMHVLFDDPTFQELLNQAPKKSKYKQYMKDFTNSKILGKSNCQGHNQSWEVFK